MQTVKSEDIRPAAVAGLFYPDDPKSLDDEITYLIEKGVGDFEGEIRALVCPHAGYMYSGLVAASGYRLLENQNYSVVAVISPSHHEYFRGVSVFNGKGYRTPLGLMPVARELADELIGRDERIFSSWVGHGEEHGLEVQLPFLQKVLNEVRIIPIVMGDQDSETCHMLAETLHAVLKDVPSLLIASSDLSHYHPYQTAARIDKSTCDLIDSYDDEGLMQALERGTCEACGGGPVVAAMRASKKMGSVSSKVLVYQNSGDVTGDHSRVVGYVSAAFGNVN
ncbi:AmmeMemoRadiSam system protein B [candidate division KSB1 bacterium]|nr:AmmeMemoRadiSam system protein B [candidate division KSB1 bacterium]